MRHGCNHPDTDCGGIGHAMAAELGLAHPMAVAVLDGVAFPVPLERAFTLAGSG